MRKGKIRLWALAPVVVAVCAAGWWAGAFCGTGAATEYSYRRPESYAEHRGPGSFDFFRDGRELLWRLGDFPRWDVWEVPGRRVGKWCGLSGLVAGALWCLVMVLRARRMVARHGKAGPSLMVAGALVGTAVGGLSSLAIHIGLQIEYAKFGWDGIVVGSLLGLTVGLVLGLPLGVIFWAVARLRAEQHA